MEQTSPQAPYANSAMALPTSMQTTAYSVALRDGPALAVHERIDAEVRYCQALEMRLGTPDDVAHVMRAIARLSQDEQEPTPEANTLLVQWQLANHAARKDAMQNLQAAPGAWFDVQLA